MLAVHRQGWLATDKPGDLIAHFKAFTSDKALDLPRAQSVNFLLSLPRLTLLPDVLYQQGTGEQILKNTCRLEEDDLVLSDFLSHRDVALLYAINQDLHRHLAGTNSEVKLAHNGYGLNLLSRRLKKDKDFALLTISESFAELLIIEGGKLVFYNQFPQDVPEDLLYYVLFVIEQNRILAPEFKLYISESSAIDLQPVKVLLTRYIGTVEELPTTNLTRNQFQYPQKEIRSIANLLALV